GAEAGRVTGDNNSAVEVVSWRQKIETWLWSKLWAIEHRLLRMISFYRLYFTCPCNRICDFGFNFLLHAGQRLLSRAFSGIVCTCGLVRDRDILHGCRFRIRRTFCGSSHLVDHLTIGVVIVTRTSYRALYGA